MRGRERGLSGSSGPCPGRCSCAIPCVLPTLSSGGLPPPSAKTFGFLELAGARTPLRIGVGWQSPTQDLCSVFPGLILMWGPGAASVSELEKAEGFRRAPGEPRGEGGGSGFSSGELPVVCAGKMIDPYFMPGDYAPGPPLRIGVGWQSPTSGSLLCLPRPYPNGRVRALASLRNTGKSKIFLFWQIFDLPLTVVFRLWGRRGIDARSVFREAR
jgi:hypothetical protein